MIYKQMVYLGYNNMLSHKRGVENVIHFQSQSSPFKVNYYLHWDTQTRVNRYENLICVGVKKNLYWFITLNVILFRLKKRKKTFIHSHNPLMSIMSVYQSNLYTVHDALYYLTSVKMHKLNKLFWILEKILYSRCNFVHFISDYAKKMSLYSSAKNYVIISNTSHFEKFKAKAQVVTRDLKKYSSGVIKVFTVRSIEPRALINLIIEVADKLKTQKIEFIIAGKGPLLDLYMTKIKEIGLKNISLLGYVSDFDLIHYYKNCDLVLIPAAFGEGFGLPIIEGYLFNKPVISSNVCAIPEIIISDDFLFENNVDSIVSKIYSAVEEKNFRYKKYYKQLFSNKVIDFKMNTLYRKRMAK